MTTTKGHTMQQVATETEYQAAVSAKLAGQTTDQLFELLRLLEAEWQAALAPAKASNDYSDVQAINKVRSSVRLEVENRHPEVEAALEKWADDAAEYRELSYDQALAQALVRTF